MRKTINRNQQLSRYISLVIISFFFANVNSVLIGASLASTISILLKIIIGVFFLLVLPRLINRLDWNMFLYIIISILTIFLNFIVFPETAPYFINTAFTYITVCFPCVLVIYEIDNYNALLDSLVKTSYIVIPFCVILLFLRLQNRLSFFLEGHYQMGLGYALVLPALIFLYKSKREKRTVFFFYAAIISFTILLCGSRGPLLEILLYYIYLEYSNNKTKQRKLFLIFSSVVLIILLLFYNKIAFLFYQVFNSIGISSRVLRTLAYDGIYLSGRDNLLYTPLMSMIDKNPYSIRGINSEWIIVGVYAHNMVLELVYQFGVVLGSLILFVIAVNIIKSFRLIECTHSDLIMLFLFSSIPCLLFSSSLWNKTEFWIWFSLYAKSMSQSRKMYLKKKLLF